MNSNRKGHRDAEYIEAIFYGDIPNLGDFFTDKEIRKFIHKNYPLYASERKRLKSNKKAIRILIDQFVNEHDNIRRCDDCGCLFAKGYVILGGEHYSCSIKCLTTYYMNFRNATDSTNAHIMFLCDFYDIDYDLHREILREMSVGQAEYYIKNLQDADIEHSETYYTEFV